MRMMVLVKATEASEAGRMPTPEFLETMGAYNRELVEAGIMRDGAGLRPTRDARRVDLRGEGGTADGPFPAEEGPVSGFWMWEVADMEEATAWARRCPTSPAGPHALELRPLYEPQDYESAED